MPNIDIMFVKNTIEFRCDEKIMPRSENIEQRFNYFAIGGGNRLVFDYNWNWIDIKDILSDLNRLQDYLNHFQSLRVVGDLLCLLRKIRNNGQIKIKTVRIIFKPRVNVVKENFELKQTYYKTKI